jgi:hypothetical protein
MAIERVGEEAVADEELIALPGLGRGCGLAKNACGRNKKQDE